jgi:hypothetical protein
MAQVYPLIPWMLLLSFHLIFLYCIEQQWSTLRHLDTRSMDLATPHMSNPPEDREPMGIGFPTKVPIRGNRTRGTWVWRPNVWETHQRTGNQWKSSFRQKCPPVVSRYREHGFGAQMSGKPTRGPGTNGNRVSDRNAHPGLPGTGNMDLAPKRPGNPREDREPMEIDFRQKCPPEVSRYRQHGFGALTSGKPTRAPRTNDIQYTGDGV